MVTAEQAEGARLAAEQAAEEAAAMVTAEQAAGARLLNILQLTIKYSKFQRQTPHNKTTPFLPRRRRSRERDHRHSERLSGYKHLAQGAGVRHTTHTNTNIPPACLPRPAPPLRSK